MKPTPLVPCTPEFVLRQKMKDLLTMKYVANRTIIQWIAMSASLTMLSACSSYQYKRMEAPDAASIKLINLSANPVYARESHKGDCTDSWPFDNDGSGIPPNSERNTPALAGTFFVLVSNGNLRKLSGIGYSICHVAVGFTVQPNASYEIAFGDEGELCGLRARWKNIDGIWQSLPLTKMKPKNMFTNPVSCEKDEQ